MIKGLFLGVAALCVAVCGVATAQSRAGIIDRIVAVVGTRPILMSEVEEQIALLQSQGQAVPSDSAGHAKLQRQVLDNMINEEMEVQQAQRDTTIKVTEREVQDVVEQRVQTVRGQFASEQEFINQLHLAAFPSIEEWRRWMTDQQRRSTFRDRLLESLHQRGKLRPIPPTDAQMRQYWEDNHATLPKRPAIVSFRQIVIVPHPDSQAVAVARAKGDSLLAELRRGADFATLAKRFSDDTLTRESGGELGWFRRGVMVPEFEAVAFRLRPGDLSPLVRTDFGFHIIQVERIQPGEIQAHHILIAPVIAPAQVAAARHLADSLHDALAAGASFDTIATRYGDPNEPRLAEQVALTDLPPDYRRAIGDDTTRGLKLVVALDAASKRPRFGLLIVIDRQPPGDYTFADMKDRIRDKLSQDLAEQHYLEQLRRMTYVDIRL
jgi:peptidyl-prolyl cis-trans isomerase SurA